MSRLTVAAVLLAALAALTASSAASPAAGTQRTGRIAFVRLTKSPGFGGPLFVVRPDGSDLRQVTPDGTKVWWYAWSPDDKLIAYIDRHGSLWLVRPDGSGRRSLVPRAVLTNTDLSWSPDGKQIVLASPGPNANMICPGRLYVVAVDGGKPRSLQARGGCAVAWSPRGDQIAYDDAKGGISVIRPDGSGRRRIAPHGGSPVWSADATKLAFSISRYSTFATADADGKDFHVVTTHAYTEYPFAWAPQARRILYGRADRQGIYVINPDSSNNHRITRDAPPQAEWPALAWSPTGGSIVYDTGEGNNTDLYVIGADGRNKVQLTDTPAIDINPSWVAR